MRESAIQRVGFQGLQIEFVMRSLLSAYFELVEMTEGILQRPVKLQLAF